MTAIAAPPPPSPARPAPRVEAPRGGGGGGTEATRAGAPEGLTPNPSLRVDPSLNIVVLEFRDAAGEVRRSIPTERELATYRAALRRGDQAAESAAPAAGAQQAAEGGAPSAPDRPRGGGPAASDSPRVSEAGPAAGAPAPAGG